MLVVLPTFNERENLPNTVARVLSIAPEAHVLVVDDNSPDGTGQLADSLRVADGRIHVLHRPGKQGLGAAYLAAFDWALQRGYDIVVECDADGSHQPEQLPQVLESLGGNDVAIGSRWVRGGRVVDWPLSRMLLSRGGSVFARWMLRLPQHDVTGGFRAFRASALRSIELDSITSQGYCFQIEMLWRSHVAGLRIAEVPITFVDRRLGVSKMRWTIALEALWRVTVWGVSLRRSSSSRSHVSTSRPGSRQARST